MKRLLLILLFLTPIFSHAQTSVYHPFPDSNAVWNVRRDSTVDIWLNYESHYYSYAIIGDTIIGSNNYHTLYVPYVKIYAPNNNTWRYQSGYRAGYLRQDTTLKKVFFYDPYYPYQDTAEFVLYDFNLNAGDTLPNNRLTEICYFFLQYPVITNVDSILINGSYRKRWNLNANTQIIEGIGSTSGLLESMCSAEDMPEFPYLTCFEQNGRTLYPDTTANCDLITLIKPISTFNFRLSISPNPVHSSFTINHGGELKIYDAMGRMIMQQTIVSYKSEFINLSLPAGIYFVRLTDGGAVYTQKLVVE